MQVTKMVEGKVVEIEEVIKGVNSRVQFDSGPNHILHIAKENIKIGSQIAIDSHGRIWIKQ